MIARDRRPVRCQPGVLVMCTDHSGYIDDIVAVMCLRVKIARSGWEHSP